MRALKISPESFVDCIQLSTDEENFCCIREAETPILQENSRAFCALASLSSVVHRMKFLVAVDGSACADKALKVRVHVNSKFLDDDDLQSEICFYISWWKKKKKLFTSFLSETL
jgi:hypothetical protein